MKVQTLIKDSTEIIRIVQLSPGDVYKRLVKHAYDSTYSLRIGIVQDAINNGEHVAVTALEFEAAYSTVTPKIEVFADDSEFTVFAATPDEIRTYFGDVLESARRQVNSTEDAAAKARAILAKVEEIGEIEGLTAPKVSRDFRAEIE